MLVPYCEQNWRCERRVQREASTSGFDAVSNTQKGSDVIESVTRTVNVSKECYESRSPFSTDGGWSHVHRTLCHRELHEYSVFLS